MQQLTVLGDTGPEEANILHSGSEMIRRQGSIKIGNSQRRAGFWRRWLSLRHFKFELVGENMYVIIQKRNRNERPNLQKDIWITDGDLVPSIQAIVEIKMNVITMGEQKKKEREELEKYFYLGTRMKRKINEKNRSEKVVN